MKLLLLFLSFLFFITSCSTKISKPHFDTFNEDFSNVLLIFRESCSSLKVQNLYPKSCKDIQNYEIEVDSAREFFYEHFEILNNHNEAGLMTGYYEPLLHGSLIKHDNFIHPIYSVPNDLISVDLALIYPELNSKRLRGRLSGQKLIPYFSREEINQQKLDADIICYVDSKLARFFLEVQGSGRIELENGSTLYIGYADQNGHIYSSIGKYLVESNKIKKEKISLQSIKTYLDTHPNELDDVLNQNKSFIFFQKNSYPAKGALGLVLTPNRSIAVDTKYTPLGAMVLMRIGSNNEYKIAFTQDIGGAIKGQNRADMFYGYGEKALEKAGREKSALNLYIIKEKQ